MNIFWFVFRKKFHSYGAVTITGEGFQILTYIRHSWPLSSEFLRCRQTKNLKYKQMEIFHQSFQYTPSNLSDVIEFSFLPQSM